MIPAPIPANDASRVQALHAYHLLDTEQAKGFDNLVDIAAHHFKTPMCMVSLVDDDRQWYKAKVGTDVCQTNRDVSFCGHVINDPKVLVVEDALTDHRFFDNPMVVGDPHVRFYAGAPLVDANSFLLGSFCILDTEPRGFTPTDQKLLTQFASLAVSQMELHRMTHEQTQSSERAA